MTANLPARLVSPEDFGPKMKALSTAKQQNFVLHMVANGGNHAAAYVAAGYSNSSPDVVGANSRRLKHEPNIIEAMQEVAWQVMHSEALPAVLALQNLVRNPNHKDHYKAIEAVLARTGFIAFTGSLNKNDNRNDKEIIAEIRALATELGVDPARLLGRQGGDIVDAVAVEVLPAPKQELILDDAAHSTEGLEDIL